jgi:MFS family permease
MKDFIARLTTLHFSKSALALYANRLFMATSAASIGLFVPIYFYEYFHKDVLFVLLIYMFIYGTYTFIVPFAGKLLAEIGSKRMLVIGVLSAIFSYVVIILGESMLSLEMFVGLFIFFQLTSVTFYWLPYHVDMALFVLRDERGRQLSLFDSFGTIILALMPVGGGFIIVYFGYSYLALFAIVFYVLSLFPLVYVKYKPEAFSFGYFESWRQIFAKQNRDLSISYFGNGVQSGVTLVFWPVFMYMVTDEQYIAVGIVAFATVIIMIVLRVILGDILDRTNKGNLLRITSFLNATGWLFKVFVETGMQLFLVDTYHKVGKDMNTTTLNIVTYEQAADNGAYVDEYTVLKEMAQNLGRLSMFLVGIVTVSMYGITSLFVIAGIASILILRLSYNTYRYN